MSIDDRITYIKKLQKKLTKTRIALLELFESELRPLTATEIYSHLHTHNLTVNKTTVYRELAFLLTQDFIREVRLTDRELHYETTSMHHHHHIICTNCEKTEGVESPTIERELDIFQNTITTERAFTINSHMLEFYGVCDECREEKKV